MDALILYCGTGGGHKAAGYALKEELESRGHKADLLDPYNLVSKKLSGFIGNGYIRLVQTLPGLFGCIYQLGEWYRKLPIHSPVYALNKKMAEPMQNYLAAYHYDVILLTHMYPGMILSGMKEMGIPVPKMIYIATDYTCIPFTEEVDCDYCVIPSEKLTGDFVFHGIDRSKILPFGIPVRHEFRNLPDRENAKKHLKLDPDRHYLLLSGGSIGAGKLMKAAASLARYLEKNLEYHLIILCGSNQKLYQKLSIKYRCCSQISILRETKEMPCYMAASDILITKPGGLTSTEAAVAGIPLIHVSPIPGCETKNRSFFAGHSMSVKAHCDPEQLEQAIRRLQKESNAVRVVESQKRLIRPDAAEKICDLAETFFE